MGTEENKAIVRRLWEEGIAKGNMAVIEDVISPNRVLSLPEGTVYRGAEQTKLSATRQHTAFPDLKITIEDIVAEGDKVVLRVTSRGTHWGTLVNPFIGTIPPTGKEVTNTLIYIYRVADGKVVEGWGLADQLGLGRQLGAIPPAPAQ